jgi:hypothetical protein
MCHLAFEQYFRSLERSNVKVTGAATRVREAHGCTCASVSNDMLDISTLP